MGVPADLPGVGRPVLVPDAHCHAGGRPDRGDGRARGTQGPRVAGALPGRCGHRGGLRRVRGRRRSHPTSPFGAGRVGGGTRRGRGSRCGRAPRRPTRPVAAGAPGARGGCRPGRLAGRRRRPAHGRGLVGRRGDRLLGRRGDQCFQPPGQHGRPGSRSGRPRLRGLLRDRGHQRPVPGRRAFGGTGRLCPGVPAAQFPSGTDLHGGWGGAVPGVPGGLPGHQVAVRRFAVGDVPRPGHRLFGGHPRHDTGDHLPVGDGS